jgi:hypothetical protein
MAYLLKKGCSGGFMKLMGSTFKNLFCLGLVLTFPSLGFSQSGSIGRIINLDMGQTILGSTVGARDVVVCGNSSGGGVVTPQPPAPPPPPPPVCEISTARNGISNAQNYIQRMATGQCPGFYVDRCGGRIEDHALWEAQRGMLQKLSSIKSVIERECQKQACNYGDIRRVMQSYDELIRYAANSSISYLNESTSRQEQIPVLSGTNMENFRVWCR